MKSFFGKLNINNFSIVMKYNTMDLYDFLSLNNNSLSFTEIFIVLKKYKNEVFENEKILRIVLSKLMRNDMEIEKIQIHEKKHSFQDYFFYYSPYSFDMSFTIKKITIYISMSSR